MIKLLTPRNKENIILLRQCHLDHIREPRQMPISRVDWLNLKDTGEDMSYPLSVTFSYEPPIDGEIVVTREGGETRVVKAYGGRAEMTNFYIGVQYRWYVRAGWMTSEVYTFSTDRQVPRMLYVEGISNVRDIGGFSTRDGGKVRQGMIYRTSEMDTHVSITEHGKSTLVDELGIRLDIDLRGINGEPCGPVLSQGRVRWVNYPMAAYDEIFCEEQMERYRQTFELLAERESYPLMVHCWGGIDRTGTWLYILGGLLGVSEEDLALDYEMSSFSRWGSRSRRSEQFVAFLRMLRRYGDNVNDACVEFLKDCGVSVETMNTIRTIFIEYN
jgi:protein-tyrosine phosphatase